jgi:leader peptidase (prepilin peptidase)/N-methyltransferase
LIIFIILFALLGLFVGSFLNVCIDRLPRGQSIIRPPSHCSECKHKLGFLDLIPVFSYIWLRGRCRYCKAHIPVKLPLIEAFTAVLFACLYWKLGFSVELLVLLVYSCLLIIIFMIDLENLLVLNKVVFPAMVLAFVFSFFRQGMGTFYFLFPGMGVESALLGGLIGFAIMLVPFLIYRQGMGMGDVKLAALVGLMTGFPLVIVAILLSWLLGGIVASILLAFKIKGRKDAVPAAIFLATTTLITLVWGQAIWQWYMP